MYVNELTFTTGSRNKLSDLLDCRKEHKDKNAAFLIFCSDNVPVTHQLLHGKLMADWRWLLPVRTIYYASEVTELMQG